ncbi:DUF481 domain-containing protein [Candidatus Pacearchaeota archaeon]|nr:DUF481 domain-containing protein [Candidatus Pacearchaeota archaeon]
MKIFTLILLMIPGLAMAGNIDLSWKGSDNYGVRSYTKGIDFSDDIANKASIDGYYRYGKTAGIVTMDEGELGLNYDPPINDRWSLWLDERVGYNKVIGIDFENYLGFGAKYYIYKTDDTKFSLSGGVLYQFTSLNCSDPTTCNQEGTGRYSYRAKFSNEQLLLIYFYQPNINDHTDYITKFTGEAKLATITDAASLLLHYKNEYRSLYGQSESSGVKLRIEY